MVGYQAVTILFLQMKSRLGHVFWSLFGIQLLWVLATIIVRYPLFIMLVFYCRRIKNRKFPFEVQYFAQKILTDPTCEDSSTFQTISSASKRSNSVDPICLLYLLKRHLCQILPASAARLCRPLFLVVLVVIFEGSYHLREIVRITVHLLCLLRMSCKCFFLAGSAKV